MNTDIVLRINNLTYIYPNEKGVDNINLELSWRNILGLLGPNGSGKSSLLRMLAGLQKPTSGSIEILGKHFSLDSPKLRRHIGYQADKNLLNPILTVHENLVYAATLYGLDKSQIKKNVSWAKDKCDLSAASNRLVKNLSKGIMQRANIAQAILHKPDILLLDEPSDGLDPIQNKNIRDLILELGQSCAIVLCSHILSEIEACCNKVAMLNHGRLLFFGPIAKIKKHSTQENLLVRFTTAPEKKLLLNIGGVTEALCLDNGSVKLTSNDRNHVTKNVLKKAADLNWEIIEIRPFEDSLEDIFGKMLDSEHSDINKVHCVEKLKALKQS